MIFAKYKNKDPLKSKRDEKRMITFLTGLTIGFVVGFMTAFIWEHR